MFNMLKPAVKIKSSQLDTIPDVSWHKFSLKFLHLATPLATRVAYALPWEKKLSELC